MVQVRSNTLSSASIGKKLSTWTKDLTPFEPSINHRNKHRPGLHQFHTMATCYNRLFFSVCCPVMCVTQTLNEHTLGGIYLVKEGRRGAARRRSLIFQPTWAEGWPVASERQFEIFLRNIRWWKNKNDAVKNLYNQIVVKRLCYWVWMIQANCSEKIV